MERVPIQKDPFIRSSDISRFKKPKGERKYNAIVKFQSSAQNLMDGNKLPGPREEAALPPKGEIGIGGEITPIGPAYTKQTLEMIKGCLDVAGKNLEDSLVSEYLVKVFGEEQANQILQERSSFQQQLTEQYSRIINPKDTEITTQ
jgi:hypothetical protein